MNASIDTFDARWATWQEKGRRQDASLRRQGWWFLGLAALGVVAAFVRVLA